jgi:prepilin-type N-terminal cleavage/methylation domain-containing protein
MIQLRNKNSLGFTLIELLVVVAIIGMLVSVIMVSFGQARLRSRDAKRLSDMTQVRSGLDLYFNHGDGYPNSSSWSSGVLDCNGTRIMDVPKDPITGAFYLYSTQNAVTGCGGVLYKDYYVEFTTEGNTEIGNAGTYYISPRGITTTAPF